MPGAFRTSRESGKGKERKGKRAKAKQNEGRRAARAVGGTGSVEGVRTATKIDENSPCALTAITVITLAEETLRLR